MLLFQSLDLRFEVIVKFFLAIENQTSLLIDDNGGNFASETNALGFQLFRFFRGNFRLGDNGLLVTSR